MHIDVEAIYACDFGDHWQKIARSVAMMRNKGAPIIGVTYDITKPARVLPVGDAERAQSLIPAHPDDFCYSKATPSALGQGGDGKLRKHIKSLKESGVKAIMLVGYYSDQCIYSTAKSLIEMQPDMDIFAIDSLCKSYPLHPDFNLPTAMARLGGQAVMATMSGNGIVTLTPSPVAVLVPAPARPTAAASASMQTLRN